MIKLAKKHKILLILSLLTVTAGGIGLGIYIGHKTRCINGIYNYDPIKDREPILKLFKDNWGWLVQNPEFSVDYFLDNLAPTKNLVDIGKSKISLYYLNGHPIGFISYYKESFYRGRIHFIAVEEKYRGKGFSQKLMAHALNYLKKEGIHTVYLNTLTTNFPAQKLYKNTGFIEVLREGPFLTFEKEL